MKNLTLTTLLLFAVSGLLTQSAVAADYPLLLVTDKTESVLYVVNAETYETVSTLKTGKGPQEIAVTPDQKTALVSNFGDHRNTVMVVDLVELAKVKDLDPTPNYRPHGMAITRDGKKLYVTCETTKSVAEMNIVTGQLLRSFKTQEFLSHMLVLSTDEKTLYTANTEAGNVSYIALVEGERSGRILSGRGCEGIAISPDGEEIWTTNKKADTVGIIDTKTKKLIHTLECPGWPRRVVFTPDGTRALVSCTSINVVNIFDVESRQSIDVIATNKTPGGITVSHDNKRAFTANFEESSVTVINLETLKPVTSFPIGTNLFGIAYVEATGRR